MPGLEGLGKILLLMGGVILFLGLLLILLDRVPLLGRLPGDLFFQKGGFRFYFPLATMIILSVVITIILNVVLRLLR